MFIKKLLSCAGLIILLSNCGGVKPTKIDAFNLTIDLPAGWSLGMDTYGGVITAEISNGGRRTLKIIPAKPTVESLDMLVKAASKSFEVVNKETLPTGFGITLTANGKKKLVYYIKKDNIQYKFEPGPYYDPADLEKSIQIAKSAKVKNEVNQPLCIMLCYPYSQYTHTSLWVGK